MVRGGGEVATGLLVLEGVRQHLVQGERLLDPVQVEVGLVEVDQARDQERVVVEVGGQVGPPVPCGGVEPPVLRPHALQAVAGDPLGDLQEARLVQHLVGLGEGRQRQAVPGGEDLVVLARGHALGARGEELLARRLHALLERLGRPAEPVRHFLGGLRPPQRARAVLEVPGVRHAEPDRRLGTQLVAQHGRQLARRPDVVAALLALRVRVQGARQAPLGRAHLLRHPQARLPRRAGEGRVSREQVGLQVERRQERVVVEHLLEVGDEPLLVGAVAREAAGQVVPDPAPSHAVEGVRDHVEHHVLARAPVVAQHQPAVRRVRELRRPGEPAPLGVETRGERLQRGVEHAGGQLSREIGRGLALDAVRERGALLVHARAVLGPQLLQEAQEGREARPPVLVLRREVGAAVEGLQVGGQEHAHRPAALTRERLDGAHVDLVEIRALLAIHLDAHEVLVEVGGDRLVLEALVLHHVAPVAGRVPDRQEDRLVLGARSLERLGTPGVPVHGVRLVLQEVGAGLLRQAVAPRFAALGGAHGEDPATNEESPTARAGLSRSLSLTATRAVDRVVPAARAGDPWSCQRVAPTVRPIWKKLPSSASLETSVNWACHLASLPFL